MSRLTDPSTTPEPSDAPDDEAAGTVDVWSVEGVFQQLVYSPKGAIEGVLIDTDGIATQFVTDAHDDATAGLLATLRPGQALVLEGIDAGPGLQIQVQGTGIDRQHRPRHTEPRGVGQGKRGEAGFVVLTGWSAAHE